MIMEINVIRLRSQLVKPEVILENTAFIEDLNDELFKDDFTLVENAKDALLSVFLIETGGTEMLFKEYIKEHPTPCVILLCNQKNNSLPASLEIQTYCELNNITCVLFPKSDILSPSLVGLLNAFLDKESFKGHRLGVLGTPSPWLIASLMDYSKIKKHFDIEMVDISLDELYEEVDKIAEIDVENVNHFDDLMKRTLNKDTLLFALKIYLALKNIVNKYNLNGFTIRCFDMLDKYKNTSCLALALLNEEGITAGCEGDVPSLLTMHILNSITGRSSFMSNPSYLDIKNKRMTFAHCTIPLNMVKSFNLPTHFESDCGVAIEGEMDLSDITMVKICLNTNKDSNNYFDYFLIESKIVENPHLQGYCRTQFTIEIEDEEQMNSLMFGPHGNHVVITYGSYGARFHILMKLLEDLDI